MGIDTVRLHWHCLIEMSAPVSITPGIRTPSILTRALCGLLPLSSMVSVHTSSEWPELESVYR